MSRASELLGLCVLPLTRPRYLNLDFFVMGFDMFHFLRGKRLRPPKVNVAKKSSRQNIKMPSNKNSANAIGLGLQVRWAEVRGSWFCEKHYLFPLAAFFFFLNKLFKDLFLPFFSPGPLKVQPHSFKWKQRKKKKVNRCQAGCGIGVSPFYLKNDIGIVSLQNQLPE